ncbi:hypothetical protein [Solitalea lacus]|uniref:hypothetical protein n=1 Tax=Solitalea lacus TaxID=2911172 RepID=UPI001EDC4590|nr:hypothetical protein [Solitalea lacus]UKJ08967.1 hypothetical protein L2B55_07310 [Solitalea lacus]
MDSARVNAIQLELLKELGYSAFAFDYEYPKGFVHETELSVKEHAAKLWAYKSLEDAMASRHTAVINSPAELLNWLSLKRDLDIYWSDDFVRQLRTSGMARDRLDKFED